MNTAQETHTFYTHLQNNLQTLQQQGLYKTERIIASRQGAEVVCEDGKTPD